MKKVEKIMSLIFVLLLFYLTKDKDILALTISFSMYIFFGSIFSTISINNINYNVFKLSTFSIIFFGLLLMISSYFVGNLLNISKLGIINIFMVVSLLFNVILNFTCQYIGCLGYKKLSNNTIDIYNVIRVGMKILLVILFFGILNTSNYINIILLYLVDIIIAIILLILMFVLIINKKRKKYNEKLNGINEIKNVIMGNKIEVIYNVIRSSYIYISIICLYFILMNRYNYSYDNISMHITNTYLYGFILIFYFHKIIKKYIDINFKDDFINNLIKIIKILLVITVFLTIVSKPISYLLFRSDYNIIVNLIPLLFVYTLYDFIININIINNKDKNVVIVLILGVVIKVIFEVPLINAVYRMGYSLILGSILSTVIGLIISIIVGLVLIKKKQKINLLNHFNELLNIIYETLIYTFIMVIFTFIINVNTNTIISSFLTICFYVFMTIIFQIIKKKIKKG